ncbi:2'-5' RNA ligase [Tistlia consotensis]|uniref:RNA 2',3'-cyclic phosphodiesterase n=1 Tax=Tistlia consotensis USBA 355 TaxID=560819 RepID=A0A1Y6CND1_9PROT|nr:RNA 2',3'-cyclic phosphodiesterase [Tistlia consotensis]SMF78154.1 2'-5' RNA ligase [Tistlia consotensis USBA 355]SNS17932.1 2'-5' RNA ligase [Tistlia consotensis]
MRLFIALSLPEEVRERLSLLAHGLPSARWVAPESLHLTLRFIGEVDGPQARDLDDMLSTIDLPEFELTLRGLGTFDEGRRLRSLWAGVEANEPLQRLQAKIESAAQRAGLPAERRKFKPHVTLARFKDNPPELKLQHYLAAHGLFRCGPFPVEDFVLFSSFLAHTGALYSPEAVYPLERVAAYG